MDTSISNELTGGLRVVFEDLNPGLRFAVYAELRNSGFRSLALTDQPQVHAHLADRTGTVVATTSLVVSAPVHEKQWAVIPPRAYLGFRIDLQTIGVPTREDKKVLLALGKQVWRLEPGNYVLKVVLTYEDMEGPHENPFIGELLLPELHFLLTEKMIAG